MPDYPPEVYRKAAEAVEPGGSRAGEAIARAVLDAVAADLGNAVAEKILACLTAGADPDKIRPPRVHDTSARTLRRHYLAAARIAAFAFLTEDDKLRLAAEALAAGQFVACPAPDDGTREH
jgi:hypothetical protein